LEGGTKEREENSSHESDCVWLRNCTNRFTVEKTSRRQLREERVLSLSLSLSLSPFLPPFLYFSPPQPVFSLFSLLFLPFNPHLIQYENLSLSLEGSLMREIFRMNYAIHTVSISPFMEVNCHIWHWLVSDATQISAFFRRTNGVLFLYDPSIRSSFEYLKEWIPKVVPYCTLSSHVRFLVAHISRLDAPAVIDMDEVASLKSRFGLIFYEISSLCPIDRILSSLVTLTLESGADVSLSHHPSHPSSPPSFSSPSPSPSLGTRGDKAMKDKKGKWRKSIGGFCIVHSLSLSLSFSLSLFLSLSLSHTLCWTVFFMGMQVISSN
jgi:hypothetical protein